MGLMRKVESQIEDTAGTEPKGGRSSAPRAPRPGKKSKLYVRPDELAHKLVKEMESGKVARSSAMSVCNLYTVYLCPDDHDRLERRQDQICARLERHLVKHVRARRYEVIDDIHVSFVVDPDLKLGNFGLLARRSGAEGAPGPTAVMPAVPASATSASSAAHPAGPGPAGAAAGTTAVIRPDEVAEHGLARQTIVLRAGNRVREFNHGRVIVGRAQDVDFRVDDPNVSRRHAAIYWADGSLMVTDLDSTNGTMVNGYPVANSVLHPSDVVTIGECKITVEAR